MPSPALEPPPRFRGAFLTPADERYESVRGVVDRRFDARPAAVARCVGVSDVQAAIEVARTHDLEIAVRSGGHGFHGLSTVDGGLVIDVGLMRDVDARPQERTARVRPGALGGDVVAETLRFGLAAVAGTRARVGFGGQVIFNGQGYLAPRHGNGCDHVLAVELVLADGRWVRATAEEEPDLFWALRGAGDSFGVVTAIEVALHPVNAVAHAGMVVWGGDDLVATLVAAAELDAALSEDIWWAIVVEPGPDGAPVVGFGYTHVGSAAGFARDIALLESIAPVVEHEHETLSYLDLHYRGGFTGERTYLTGCQLRSFDRDSASVLVQLAEAWAQEPDDAAGRLRSLHVYPHSKGLGRPGTPPNACGLREGFAVNARVSYDDPGQEAGHVAWADGAVHAFVDPGLTLRGFNGTSLNYVSRLSDEIVAAYYGDDLPRLKQIKHHYDPDDLFRRNVAITARGA
jgi:FAD/FMN-containing dehydrogenase